MNRHQAQQEMRSCFRNRFPLVQQIFACLALIMLCSPVYAISNDFLGGEDSESTAEQELPAMFVSLRKDRTEHVKVDNLFLLENGSVKSVDVEPVAQPVQNPLPQSHGPDDHKHPAATHECEVCDGKGKLNCPHCQGLLVCLHCGGDGVCDVDHAPAPVKPSPVQAPRVTYSHVQPAYTVLASPQNCAGGNCGYSTYRYTNNSYRGSGGYGLFGRRSRPLLPWRR